VEATAEAASEDPLDVWRRVRRDPSAVEPLRHLYRIYGARGELDKQWCVSQALVVTGAANGDEQASFEQHRSQALISPKSSLTEEAWHKWLFHPEQELLTGQIFGIITPATVVGRVSALRRSKRLHIPAKETEVDIQKATVTAIRALGWGAALLGIHAPTVHLEKDRDTGFEHIPAVPPLTVVGRQVLSGLGQTEHAFLAGRHLAWYRPESYIRRLFSAIPDLEDLFMAALTIGNPGLPISADKKQRVAPVAQAIEPMLNPGQVDTLRACFLRFVEEGGRTNLQRYASGSEKTACRAGLLLSNDLSVAAKVLEKEEGKLGDLLKDLIVFATGDSYFELRKHLGIQVS
jgi:hypothetical protein